LTKITKICIYLPVFCQFLAKTGKKLAIFRQKLAKSGKKTGKNFATFQKAL